MNHLIVDNMYNLVIHIETKRINKEIKSDFFLTMLTI